ncbi:leucine-rich repeat protein [Treponema sp. OMZ 792]|uniref:leucine-rich repeat protein n=1 Tax=unclassified Treponema TaxID=2638727 RepID=UPI0020A2CE5D|nr:MULTISPECIES: leucine-rich repeat protein [unclassified Treponema]UTC75214.1 leucine-rich repeat protein [Treponema sp. OMZ 792]UTC79221.1 leucine-rich repeat protein [Treponema sp. OMZ 798]
MPTALTATGSQIILKNNSITELKCFNNKLTALDVRGLSGLQKLVCDKNQLTSLDLQNLAELRSVVCFENKLTSLNVQNAVKLEKLFCRNNELQSLLIQNTPKLKEFTCNENKLNAAAFTGILTNLPTCAAGDGAKGTLFKTSSNEHNYDFTDPLPADLRDAFYKARDTKKWKLIKKDSGGVESPIILPHPPPLLYVPVDYADLENYLNTEPAATDGVYYIEITGTIPAAAFKGDSSGPGALGQKIQNASPKKIDLKLPETVAGLVSMESCFRDCTDLVSLANIPANVTNMSNCFSGCTSLIKGPDIPEGVNDMSYCFKGCSSLKKVKLNCPYNASGINFAAVFFNCNALEIGGIQVKTAHYDAYTTYSALEKMKVPPVGNQTEQKKKFSTF